ARAAVRAEPGPRHAGAPGGDRAAHPQMGAAEHSGGAPRRVGGLKTAARRLVERISSAASPVNQWASAPGAAAVGATTRVPLKLQEPESALRPVESRPPHPFDPRNIAVGFAADIVFEADVVAEIVDEARRPVGAVIGRIVDGDHVLELRRAD